MDTKNRSNKAVQRRVKAPQRQKKRAKDSAGKQQITAKQAERADSQNDKLPTSPNLFANREAARMTVALPIWEASNILTQGNDLAWAKDSNGKLRYARQVGDGTGSIYFWVTEDLDDEHPATLAGAAALACIDTFDIRAACMHLLYAAHATQLEKPWEQELVIDDRQIEEYLGLRKRTDKNRQQKLALIEEIAKQPSKITTYVSWPTQGRKKGFTVEEGRLWHIIGTRYHYQNDLLGKKELIGMTFIVRPGQWAKYFLNEEEDSPYCGTLSTSLLQGVMQVWQHREGAARLMVWLLFKSKVDRHLPLGVQTLMEVAYGAQRVQEARGSSELRKKLARGWDEDILTLTEHGWEIIFDPQSYPEDIQPSGFGRGARLRPRGFFEKLLAAWVWINPPIDISSKSTAILETNSPSLSVLKDDPPQLLNGDQVRQLRSARGWSQRKLATMAGISQGLVCLIEKNARPISLENNVSLRNAFGLN